MASTLRLNASADYYVASTSYVGSFDQVLFRQARIRPHKTSEIPSTHH